jgi:hypothetical protein
MRRAPTIFSVAALVLIALIAFILLRDDGGITRTTFEDGSVLVLRKVAYGKNHRMTGGTWWQRLVGPLVPATIAKKWKIPVAICTNTHPVLMVWVEHRTDSSTNRGTSPILYSGSFAPAPFALQDDAGTELPQYVAGATATTPSGKLIGIPFQTVPRLSRDLSFRLIFCALQPQRHYSASVQFPNPLFDKNWPGSPLNEHSISTTQNNLRVELGDLRRWRRTGYSRGLSECGTLLQCQITDLEDSRRGWSVVSVNIPGENGAVYQCRTGHVGIREMWDEYEFHATLATNQVWPLQLELYRSLPGSNQCHTVRSIPVPDISPAETFTPVRVPLNGTTVVVRGFASFARPSMVHATVEPPNNELLLVLVQARSSGGEVLRIRQRNLASAYNTSELVINTPGVTHVDLTYALTPKVYVNVLARPNR